MSDGELKRRRRRWAESQSVLDLESYLDECKRVKFVEGLKVTADVLYHDENNEAALKYVELYDNPLIQYAHEYLSQSITEEEQYEINQCIYEHGRIIPGVARYPLINPEDLTKENLALYLFDSSYRPFRESERGLFNNYGSFFNYILGQYKPDEYDELEFNINWFNLRFDEHSDHFLREFARRCRNKKFTIKGELGNHVAHHTDNVVIHVDKIGIHPGTNATNFTLYSKQFCPGSYSVFEGIESVHFSRTRNRNYEIYLVEENRDPRCIWRIDAEGNNIPQTIH